MNILRFNLNDMEKLNNGFSYYILGRSYDLEENGVTENFKLAMKYYKKGYEMKHPLCEYSIGMAYKFGLGDEVTVDEVKGDKLLKNAYPKIKELIDNEAVDDIERLYAKFVTGAYYYWGLGKVEENHKEAFRIISECAEKGHIAAIYDLGANFYYKGNGTEKNILMSEKYLRLAKEAGLKRAIQKYEEYGFIQEVER